MEPRKFIIALNNAELVKAGRYVGEMPLPSPVRKGLICNDQCETCPLNKIGCAKKCVRFPDQVCSDCPCRASRYAGEINESGKAGIP